MLNIFKMIRNIWWMVVYTQKMDDQRCWNLENDAGHSDWHHHESCRSEWKFAGPKNSGSRIITNLQYHSIKHIIWLIWSNFNSFLFNITFHLLIILHFNYVHNFSQHSLISLFHPAHNLTHTHFHSQDSSSVSSSVLQSFSLPLASVTVSACLLCFDTMSFSSIPVSFLYCLLSLSLCWPGCQINLHNSSIFPFCPGLDLIGTWWANHLFSNSNFPSMSKWCL